MLRRKVRNHEEYWPACEQDITEYFQGYLNNNVTRFKCSFYESEKSSYLNLTCSDMRAYKKDNLLIYYAQYSETLALHDVIESNSEQNKTNFIESCKRVITSAAKNVGVSVVISDGNNRLVQLLGRIEDDLNFLKSKGSNSIAISVTTNYANLRNNIEDAANPYKGAFCVSIGSPKQNSLGVSEIINSLAQEIGFKVEVTNNIKPEELSKMPVNTIAEQIDNITILHSTGFAKGVLGSKIPTTTLEHLSAGVMAKDGIEKSIG